MALTDLAQKLAELEESRHLMSEAEYQTLKDEILNLEKKIMESGTENNTIH